MNQMDHQYYQERLSAFADNELPPPERALLETHLRDCVECQRRLAELGRLEDLVAEHGVLDDSDYWEEAARKIETALPGSHEVVDLDRARKRHSALWWRLPAIAASVVFLVYLGLHERDIVKQPAPSITPPTPGVGQSAPRDEIESTRGQADRPEVLKDAVGADRGVTLEAVPEPKAVSAPDSSGRTKVRSQVSTPKVDAVSAAPSSATDLASPSAAPKPEPVQDLEESNYEQVSRERSAAAATVVTEQESDAKLDSSLLRASDEIGSDLAELVILRERRDSLESVVLESSKAQTRPRAEGAQSFTGKGSESAVDLKVLMDPGGAKEKKARGEQTETALVETWFGICKVSQDSVEVDRGVAYLKIVAENGAQDNRRLAERYLKEIDRQ